MKISFHYLQTYQKVVVLISKVKLCDKCAPGSRPKDMRDVQCESDIDFFAFQVQAASNSNQKEKYEADLKKEIKKLQVMLFLFINIRRFFG